MFAFGIETLAPAAALLLLAHWLSWRQGFQPFGRVVARVDTDQRVVALTFDDGPSTLGLDAILPALAGAGAAATFYLNGVHLAARPDLGRRIVAGGHEIGNHGYSHRALAFVSPRQVRREIERTDRAIRNAGYRGPITFRPPFGRKLLALPFYLARRRRVTVMWDAAPDLMGCTKAPERIVADAMAAVRPGSILLLHAMFPANAHSRDAVPLLLSALREAGYRFVTVSDLLALGRPVRPPFPRFHGAGRPRPVT